MNVMMRRRWKWNLTTRGDIFWPLDGSKSHSPVPVHNLALIREGTSFLWAVCHNPDLIVSSQIFLYSRKRTVLQKKG